MSARGVKIKREGNLISVEPELIPELWDIKELCEFLGVTEDWVYRRTMKDAPNPVPHIKVGHFLRFIPGEIYAWLRKNQRR